MPKSKSIPKNLTQKIQSLKATIKDLDQLENNNSAEIVSQLLVIMTNMFKEVEQRLIELESKMICLKLKNSKTKSPIN